MPRSRTTTRQAVGAVEHAPLRATAATIDGDAFRAVLPSEAIPPTWEERARQAWTYYVEEPLVKNCLNSWRSFAVGDEIKLTSAMTPR